ncbi:hypothetical protein BCEN4_1600028 [Burkholderia cenocepacia]|nr:hypothetical protein BCEN4_1600028 [Burkholderia cenocepacia]
MPNSFILNIILPSLTLWVACSAGPG